MTLSLSLSQVIKYIMQLPLKKKKAVKKLFELPDYQCTFDFPFVPSSGQQHLKVIPGFVF